jgi:hypothetical protein
LEHEKRNREGGTKTEIKERYRDREREKVRENEKDGENEVWKTRKREKAI